MRIKIIILAAISLSLSISLSATDTNLRVFDKKDILHGRYLKFSPFPLLELEPSFQVGYEYPTGNIRIQHEIGYVGLFNPAYGIGNFDFNEITSAGIKLRTTIKFPLRSDKPNRPIKYFGIDFMYKYLTWTQKDIQVQRMGSYWQFMDITTEKNVAAIHFIYGFNGFISQLNNIVSDSYFGIGLRYKQLSNNIPDDVNEDFYPWWDQMDGMMISIMAGFKFGFGI
ncbi:MAG: hypothetical protein JXR34_02550 [Bacteroidales bacterium]|nr:hypothetical protein [Bacteroidales bacterium]